MPRNLKYSLPPGLSTEVRERYHYRCAIRGCRRSKGVSLHHITPRAEGGENIADNLLPLCQGHHDAIELTDRRSIEAIQAHFALNPLREEPNQFASPEAVEREAPYVIPRNPVMGRISPWHRHLGGHNSGLAYLIADKWSPNDRKSPDFKGKVASWVESIVEEMQQDTPRQICQPSGPESGLQCPYKGGIYLHYRGKVYRRDPATGQEGEVA